MQFALQGASLKERRPWQDSNLQSLLRVAREGARTNALSIWPQGQAHACCNEKRPWQDSNLHMLVQPSRHHPEGVAQRAVCQNGKRIQCLIHSATGSSVSLMKEKATLAGFEPANLVKSNHSWSRWDNALSIRPQGQIQRRRKRCINRQSNPALFGK